MLGKVTSINASLTMLVADATIAAAWRGLDDGDDGESDCDRLTSAIAEDDFVKIEVGGSEALGLSLAVGQGIVRVYRSGKSLVLVEGFGGKDEEPSFLADMALPPAQTATRAGDVRVTSGKLVFMPSTDDCADIEQLAKKATQPTACGSEGCGLLVPIENGTYAVLLEDERVAPWGTARRALLVPAQ